MLAKATEWDKFRVSIDLNLCDVPDEIWNLFKARAKREGWPNVGFLVKQLMADYGDGSVSPTKAPTK